jgi:hypothetical protein
MLIGLIVVYVPTISCYAMYAMEKWGVDLTLGGHTDWRLPTFKELRSIADYTKINPAIDTVYFPTTLSSFYWTSTTNLDASPEIGFQIYFWYGTNWGYSKDDDFYVRAIRGGWFKPCPEDNAAPTGAVHAYPNMIWSPNNKMVNVILTGYVMDDMSITRDGSGIGVSSALLLIDGTNTIVLRDASTDLLYANGNFSVDVQLQATKGAEYRIELLATDTNPDAPNTGIVDTTVVRVPKN